jgi:hypothetical protein
MKTWETGGEETAGVQLPHSIEEEKSWLGLASTVSHSWLGKNQKESLVPGAGGLYLNS